ncbi:AAA family ATPase [Actinoplanes sp. Pm04-4]|uniref:AAA family ATPase n=1 Tax=Paractinoplanes pyxinae TaxID=2997416 RepID=A0ABT4BEL2_9ACTN|nr:AAA family ATPase [Actinoplanes pyxinae]MCY1144013.1 AAA family ATPase [Actinoplanes pyxinae]
MSRTLIITRGLPGAGKTTRAMSWVAQDPQRRARVGSDQIAAMLHPHALTGGPATYSSDFAKREQLVVNAAIEALLRSGIDVVCDDPYLLPHYLEAVRELAARCDAEPVVWDMTDIDVETCIARDAQRGRRSIGEQEIRQQYQVYRSHKTARDGV